MADYKTTKIGYITSRASNDVRQGVATKVIGVLKYNNEIREKLLKRNIGKYELADISEGIGYIPDFYALENSKPFSLEKEGLLGHTHLVHSTYQNYIKTKYDFNNGIEYYTLNSLKDYNFLKWGGEFDNYIYYINNIHLTNIDDNINSKLISNNNEYLNNQQSLSIKPNQLFSVINDKKTTKLGLISNETYINTLKNSAIYNSSRNVNYITPESYNIIGLKENTIDNLDDYLIINPYTGRLDLEFYSQTRNIEDEEWKNVFGDNVKITLNGQYNPLDFNIKQNQKYKPFQSYDYISIANESILSDYIPNYGAYTNETEIYNTLIPLDSDTGITTTNNSLLSKTALLRTKGINGNEYQKDYYTPSERYIDTLINEYHTQGRTDKTHNRKTLLQSAITNFGMSHGRNLLTKKPKSNNPYCRVWIKNAPYNNFEDTINLKQHSNKNKVFDILSKIETKERVSNNRLETYSVLNQNGFINISPIIDVNNKGETINNTNIKRCMFSIENLAWKDYANKGLTAEQIGPNGGRIMWFPPYNLDFNEVASAQWNTNDFIGRGEKIYTYTNSERTGTLSFSLLVDHPSILNVWKKNAKTKTNEQEEDVLRFFVGCSPLEIPQPENKEEKKDEQKENNGEDMPFQSEPQNDIIFYIFFPNYFSGMDGGMEGSIYAEFDAKTYLAKHYDATYATDVYLDNKKEWSYLVDKKYYNKQLKYYYNYNENNNIQLNNNLTKVKENYDDVTHTFNQMLEYDFSTIKNATVTISGYASNHGKEGENNSLSENRHAFAKQFLEEVAPNVKFDFREGTNSVLPVNNDEKDNISGLSAKLARCAKVVISDINKPTEDSNSTPEEKEQEKIRKQNIQIREKNNKEFWGNEAQYFSMLQSSNNFLYQSLVDKIQYFTPAFHSITPEGFNARLAFLHQCTRQGLTSATSDGIVKHRAGNMAFGRPPICVLRIGDFYHTKVIINSVTINYNKPQWDLNAEGIGLQPMYADISLNFVFLGGSDIEGPISRLQNAVSFNYYANQSVYDKRADTPSSETKWSPLSINVDNNNSNTAETQVVETSSN